MKEQNFKNHARFVPLFHYVLSTIVIAIVIMSVIHLVNAWQQDAPLSGPIMFVLIGVALLISFINIRSFPLAAQDRAIRAEENLRHFTLTGKLLDGRLTMPQVIALRFAPDAEFTELAERAAKENLSNSEIKKAIRDWKADHHRA
jgi:hypothetical protein